MEMEKIISIYMQYMRVHYRLIKVVLRVHINYMKEKKTVNIYVVHIQKTTTNTEQAVILM